MPDYDDNIVYSTDSGRVTKEKSNKNDNAGPTYADGYLRVKRETKGRKGKGVTTISGIDINAHDIKKIAANLKKHCSTGGAVKAGIIEIQGDQKVTVKAQLEKLGFKVKLAGG